MNHARFRDDLNNFRDVLVSHGVPCDAIEDIISFADQTAIIAEAKHRNDRQFELQYREHGSTIMAQRLGVTPQAVRKRFNKIIAKPNNEPSVARMVA